MYEMLSEMYDMCNKNTGQSLPYLNVTNDFHCTAIVDISDEKCGKYA
jgi:hypothetical protein